MLSGLLLAWSRPMCLYDGPRSCTRKECTSDPCSNCRESGKDEKELENRFQRPFRQMGTINSYMFSFSAGAKYKGGYTPQTTGPTSRSKLTMVVHI